MARQSKVTVKESVEELNKLLISTNNYKIKQRIKCLILTKSNKFKTQSHSSNHIGVSLATVKRWLKQYKDEGLESLTTLKSGGNKKSLITPEIHNSLSKRLTNSQEPFRGYWDVQDWVREKYNLDLNYNTVRTYLIRHFKTKLKTPRKSHYKKSDEAEQAFLKTTKCTKPI